MKRSSTTRRITWTGGLVALVLASTAGAQTVGTYLPSFRLVDFSTGDVGGLEDFAGRTVLIDLFGHYEGGCQTSVPRVSSLLKVYGPKGLSVVGVTAPAGSETRDQLIEATQPFAERFKLSYPWAVDEDGELFEWTGASTIPYALLVDPTGRIVWRGHPFSELDAEDIEPHLERSITKPVWEWPESAEPVKKELRKRYYDKAYEAARELRGKDRKEVLASLDELVRIRMDTLEEMRDTRDFLGVEELVAVLKEDFQDLDVMAEVEAIELELLEDTKRSEVIGIQRKLVRIRDHADRTFERLRYDEPPVGLGKYYKRAKEVDSDLKFCRLIQERFAGGAAAIQAEKLEKHLRKVQGKLT